MGGPEAVGVNAGHEEEEAYRAAAVDLPEDGRRQAHTRAVDRERLAGELRWRARLHGDVQVG